MAAKSKEMAEPAMKVVIRRHWVCTSLSVKVGGEKEPPSAVGNDGLRRRHREGL
jgi:hypothetical protein